MFADAPDRILTGPPRDPLWLPGASLNIVDSCFTAPGGKTAIVFRADGVNHEMSYSELRNLVSRFAGGLSLHGVAAGDGVAIAMPMTVEAVVAYLGTVAAGARVVSIADSFAPHEIATRLGMTDPALVVTQDRFPRAGREHAMFDKVVEAGAGRCVVVGTGAGVPLRQEDIAWRSFLVDALGRARARGS